MKIILVATDTRGKNLAFVSESLKVLSLEDAIRIADKNLLENAYTVNGTFGAYLRSLPNTLQKDNVDALSVTAADIVAYTNRTRHFQSTDAISLYAAHYSASLLEHDVPFIETADGDKAFVDRVRDMIMSHSKIIAQAAKEFDIDRHLLGAILIDEVVRMGPFEAVQDIFWLHLIGRNVSVGLAQVKLETANSIIKKGLYNPNPDDKKLPFVGTLSNKDRNYLYPYVVEPKHNIRFAAAYIRDIVTVWAKKIDLLQHPEIVATLYPQGYGNPNPNPKSNERGDQVATEFYRFAKKWIE